MHFGPWTLAALSALVLLCGCGGDELELAEVGGVVTYQGEPLPGATVTFIPEEGPPAVGTTNEQGEFSLVTHGRSGAAVGPHTISVIAQKDEREITPGEAETMKTEDLMKIRKSLIPEKYAHPRTSGLAETVSDDPSANRFTLELRN